MNIKTDAGEMFLKDLPPEAQRAVTRQLSALTDAVTQGAMNWGFEVVKQLSVLNGAGLAAIVAIAQTSNTMPADRILAFHGARIFVAGLCVALFSMLAIYATGLFFVRKFARDVLFVTVGTRPISALLLSRGSKLLIAINWTLALISVALFIGGAISIAAIT